MERRFDLVLVNRRQTLLILGGVLLGLICSVWLARALPAASQSLAVVCLLVLVGLGFVAACRLLRCRALYRAPVTLSVTELLVQCGASQPQRVLLAEAQRCRYVVARGAHTLLYSPAGRLRLVTSEVLAGPAQGARFAEMAQAVTQRIRQATPSPAAAGRPRPRG